MVSRAIQQILIRFVLKFIRGSLGESTIYINCNTCNREKVKIILHTHVFDTRQQYTYFAISNCFPWLSIAGDYRVTDEALLAETT